MERIVLGYDGSPAAISALNWTAARSTRGMTKVDVVLVASPSTKDRTPGVERLAEAEAALRERIPGLEVELHRLDGAVTTSLAEAAEGADLVVIGIHTGHPIRAAVNGWTPLRAEPPTADAGVHRPCRMDRGRRSGDGGHRGRRFLGRRAGLRHRGGRARQG